MRHHPIGLVIVAAHALALMALPAYADDKKCTLQQYAQMPVTMAGTKALITGTINGKPARFFADSGAFYSILTREAMDKFGLHPIPNITYPVRGTSGIENMKVTRTDEFTVTGFVGGRVIKDVEFLVGSNTFAGVADGLIGQNVLGTTDTEFDLANGLIRLFRPMDCKGKTLAYWAGNSSIGEVSIDSITSSQKHLIGDAKLNGKKIRIVFDTGASRSILELRAAARVGIKPESDGVVAGGMGQGIGKQVNENWIARFDSLDIGGEVIKNARLRMGDINISNADMLLGADFFLSHRVYVAAKQKKIYFTYNGGQVFDFRSNNSGRNVQATPVASPAAPLETPALDAAVVPVSATPPPLLDLATTPAASAADGRDKPADAAGFRRRGSAFAGRRDFGSAIADFDEAIKLEPANAENYYARATARAQNRQPQLAMADLDQALKLKPDYVDALITRGTGRLSRKNLEGGRADMEAATRLAQNDPTVQLQIAESFGSAGSHDDAIERLGAWVTANPKDSRVPKALMQRCWSRALLGKELDLALADCNSALRKGSENSQVLDSRAFVQLQRGDLDKAIDDYKTSIKLQPKNAFPIYGLGIAEMKKGLTPKGQQDIQAALAINPNIAEPYKRRGLIPQ